MFVSLVALDSFHLLLSTQLTADLTPEWSGGSMFHPLSHIYAKTPFCYIETDTKNTLNHQHVVFDRVWANTTTTLNTAFSLRNDHAKWWIHFLLISSTLLSHTTSTIEFFGFYRDNCWIWATWVLSIICVCTTAFKVSILLLNCCFWQSRVWITLLKPLLCLNSNFSHQKAMLYQHNKIQIFPLFWKSATVASIK